jgi:hypothetical protein
MPTRFIRHRIDRLDADAFTRSARNQGAVIPRGDGSRPPPASLPGVALGQP